ncbi:uncharacterized protein LOC116203989 [Punica granatum]|uniref:Uncharacterized protein LOC116203989 n=2 Tax=Punica granatum TaxID=22663 RepID=A0A6P8D5P4_PUNGR|nr:uncharacterized protein LOC116203989 [Punica granatum]XP_031391855.1 uncharacterized protein LOC116203989 [Punica granatum]XP_031391856.1 uncharacterized protein LOC116203989 [Punica granatum]XP_031391857.1 uncharacterized protein LOC116203989 [Punica granatum]OWM83724.1 hypothetical protein CDL15_Pgr004154 [Punica granatum]PKI55547.1 hypothetical protein CRG98_024047 [Punica granatum]
MELLCQESCILPGQVERRKKRKRDDSHKGEGNKVDISDLTPQVLDSCGTYLADSTSDLVHDGDASLLNESEKRKNKKKKKGREEQDVDAIKTDDSTMSVEGPSSVPQEPIECCEPVSESNVLLAEGMKKRKKNRKKEDKVEQETEIADPDYTNVPAEGSDFVMRELNENTEPVSKSKKKKNKKKKQEEEMFEQHCNSKLEQETDIANSDNTNMPVEGSDSVMHELNEDTEPVSKSKKNKNKKKQQEEKMIDQHSNNKAAGADSTRQEFNEETEVNGKLHKKKKKKNNKKKVEQDTEVAEPDNTNMPAEGSDSVMRDLNENREPISKSKKKNKKKKQEEEMFEQHSNTKAAGADSALQELNEKTEVNRKLHKKKKKNKVEQDTEVAEPDNTNMPAEGSDSVMHELNENPEPVSKSKKKNKKKKQEEEMIEQHNNNKAAGADSSLQELKEKTEMNGKLNKKKKKNKEKMQKLEVVDPNGSSAPGEGPCPLLLQSNAKAEPVDISNNFLQKNGRRREKCQKTEETGVGDSNVPDKVPTSALQIAEKDFENNGECPLTSGHQNGALEKNQHPASPAQVALAISSIEASSNCLEKKAGLTDCLENLRLHDQQQGITAFDSVENSFTLVTRDHKNYRVLEIDKERTSQILVECGALTSCNQGASILSNDDSFHQHPDHKVADADADIKEINRPASEVVVSADVVMETTKEDKPQPILDSLLDANNAQVSRKKLLILDLNGLLVDVVPSFRGRRKPDMLLSGKYVFKRPFIKDFLQFCFERFAVAIWSSRTKKNIDLLINFLFGDSREKLVFCWHQSQCTQTKFTTIENKDKPLVLKELRRVWEKLEPALPWEKGEYNESNTLLLDDSPYKALRNPENTAIFPYSYQHNMRGDNSLGPGGDLRVYLENIALAENVQEYVRQNPFGQRAISRSNPSWHFYEKVLQEDPPRKRERVSRWDR